MNTLSMDIKDILELLTDWSFKEQIFVGREPTAPHNTLTIFDQSGQGPLLTYEKNDDKDETEIDRYEYSAFQIRTRSKNYDQAMQWALKASKLLHNKGNYEINNTLYTIEAMDSPSLLEWDDNNRALIIVNYFAQRTPKPT